MPGGLFAGHRSGRGACAAGHGRFEQAADLQAKLPIGEMFQRFFAGQDRIIRCDRIADRPMLRPDCLHEVLATCFVGPGHAHRVTQILLEKRDDLSELRIAASLTDGSMKFEVFIDTVTAGAGRGINRGQLAADGGDLGPAGPLCGERCNFTFDDPSHFDDLNNRLNRFHHLGVEGERTILTVGNENPCALSRDQQSARLELVYRFPNHGARYAVRFGKLSFGGQSRTGAHSWAFKLLCEQRGEPI